ncbi:hypothetical protein B0H19DRAFT_1142877 [Mycena capillaripes]|nr:hypothetical protein B0H19DRAFT_1142877 [Mycena capillaripes]
MIDCLRLVPGLRELFLFYDTFSATNPDTDSDTDPLIPTAQNLDSVLCPQLQVVNFMQFFHVSDQMLLEFLRARTGSRFPGIAQLSKAHVHFMRPIEVDIVPELREAIIPHGDDFALRYAPRPLGYSPSQDNREHVGEGESFTHDWALIPITYPVLTL